MDRHSCMDLYSCTDQHSCTDLSACTLTQHWVLYSHISRLYIVIFRVYRAIKYGIKRIYFHRLLETVEMRRWKFCRDGGNMAIDGGKFPPFPAEKKHWFVCGVTSVHSETLRGI